MSKPEDISEQDWGAARSAIHRDPSADLRTSIARAIATARAEGRAEPATAARFARLYDICRRILWADASTPAFENEQTKAAFDDLAEFMFMDGIDAAMKGGSNA